MITNLNSWSFEPSSNKSVESFDPSIPIPSDGQSAAGTASATVPFTFNPSAPSLYPQVNGPGSSHSYPLVFIRGSFSPHQPANLTNLTFLTFPNPLIARVCTPLHINQNFFPTPLRVPPAP